MNKAVGLGVVEVVLLSAAATPAAMAACSNTAPPGNTTVTCSGTAVPAVAAQTGSDEIVVDDVGGKSGGVRRLRDTLADALHGRPEFSGNRVLRRRGRLDCYRAISQCRQDERRGTQISPVSHSESLGATYAQASRAPP